MNAAAADARALTAPCRTPSSWRRSAALHEIQMLASQDQLALLVGDLDCLHDYAVRLALGMDAALADARGDGQRIADEYRPDEPHAVVAVRHRPGVYRARRHADPDA